MSTGGLSGKTCVVTGATSGIGFETAREFARRGAEVLLVGRVAERCAASVDRIRSETGNLHLRSAVADLASLRAVRILAEQVSASVSRLDVLVNNAGAIFARRSETEDGFERTWALNVLSPFLLSRLLQNRLRASAPARIVNVSSAAHFGARLDFENLEARGHYSGYRTYGRSKLALILISRAMARRLESDRVTVNALHPGFVATRFGLANGGGFAAGVWFTSRLFGIRPAKGARTTLYVATAAELAGVTGRYFARGRESVASAKAGREADGERLWQICSQQTGLAP
jgi:retinol dehydrogenase 12